MNPPTYGHILTLSALGALLALQGCGNSQQPADVESSGTSTSIQHPELKPQEAVKRKEQDQSVDLIDRLAGGPMVQYQQAQGKPSNENAASKRLQRLRSAPALSVMQESEAMLMPGDAVAPMYGQITDRENYLVIEANAVKRVSEHPVSTFSVDVDTGSYSNVRRMLKAGQLPPSNAVRIEEMLNYFDYAYPGPQSTNLPFVVNTEMAPAPWDSQRVLLRIGLQGYEVPSAQRPASNLVFLVDVSGSMQSPDKLPLLKRSLQMLTRQMRPEDRISLVVYAGASGVVLKPTPGNRQAEISQALQQLEAGGSTNGGAGIELAYLMAQQAFIEGGINRVVLATDGDFNVGTVNQDTLKNLIERRRQSGISLTTLGFGQGNYNDALMEQLADVGNGNHAYIDTLNEARKVLVDELGSTLQTIASDVKIQIEFNPAKVSEYRLIGYENRLLAREDFTNDKVDAGDIGAGHNVTALYELTLQGGRAERIEPLRYGTMSEKRALPDSQELAFLRLRYKLPGQSQSRLLEQPLNTSALHNNLEDSSESLRFAAAVAGFGQLLRGGHYTNQFDYEGVAQLAAGARGQDLYGYRGEFLQLVHSARELSRMSQQSQSSQPSQDEHLDPLVERPGKGKSRLLQVMPQPLSVVQ
ncbi:VWA domain-containing protein [Aestuariirhabdus sp. Z084]|uniref:vWA domain-containing protein n=1 Tax=Aestuariirhabdus haliotis TaxID=2918751 RepID=UPI00201B3BE4|nr:VWA domain-containing protein [Aestuariirhabdus haliotis]MCL6415297.1 VWA domain-containing protein [Aestuariirhabdus haliotis]MCL6419557.1 VWA domain-containing protein [Aestuariirhabdus haliotis]